MTPSARKVSFSPSFADFPDGTFNGSLCPGDCGHGVTVQAGGVLGVGLTRQHPSPHPSAEARAPYTGAEKGIIGAIVGGLLGVICDARSRRFQAG